MRSLWTSWPVIERRILSQRKILLLLDFDGTLVPIARTPHAVVLDKKIKLSLKRLCASISYQVVIISGRSLKDLLSYFKLPRVVYVGNHGLEIKGKELRITHKAKKARKLEALVRLLGQKLKEDLLNIPGLFIEDKNYTLSVHYRNISREYTPFFKQEITRFKKKHEHWPLIWKEGKKVWEVRPRVRWGKGDMALHLMKKMPGVLPIVIGDDVTDEDMFKVLKSRGITIRVGRSMKSAAQYFVKSPKEVGVLLQRLCDAKT